MSDGTFEQRVEPFRRQIHLHCYRMLGSLDEADDLTQETLLRAWRARDGFEGRSSLRTWLYRIATNACLDHLEKRARGPMLMTAEAGCAPMEEWLQPYPDQMLDQVASGDAGPESVLIERETIELIYLVAIQHLPPRQRAVLILRDALGWSSRQTADLLEDSVPSVTSALQRARTSVRTRLPARRLEWGHPVRPTAAETNLLERYMDATERGDVAALSALLREDVRLTMPPSPTWFERREEVVAMFTMATTPGRPTFLGEFMTVATAANRQPALAAYVRRPGDSSHRALGIDVLQVEEDLVVKVTRFVNTDLFPVFGLPLVR